MKLKPHLILSMIALCANTIATAQPVVAPSSSYTQQQAQRGQTLYVQQCQQCHGAGLEGVDKAPPLAGPQFSSVWAGQPLGALLGRINTMPPEKPGSLPANDSVDLLAFLLWYNGQPAGNTPLALDQLALARVEASSVLAPEADWATYGGNLASHRYAPFDQINADNFKDLKIAWRLNTNFLGPRPDTLYSTTPLYVNGVLYATAGTRRAVVALDPASGEMLWMHRENEGARGDAGARGGAGRGLAYWSSDDGRDQRIIYVTPGYRMLALDARTGEPVEGFGDSGIVDLKKNFDQEVPENGGNIGLNATPLVVGNVIVVGAAHRPAGAPDSTWDVHGYVRGYDARTGERLWIFHTIPLANEFGYDTWQDGAAEQNGNTGVWAQMSADEELGLVYLPVEMPSADYNGFNRPGDGLFGESLVAVDVNTGEYRWHYQMVHHGLWDFDLPAAPILFDMQKDGETIKALAQPTKQAFLFVLNRETGEPIWPIEERPVPQSQSPFEKTSPTQPFPTWPEPFDRQGFDESVLNDLTPELFEEAKQVMSQYEIGPLYTPPAVERPGAKLGTLMLPADVGGANWPGGSFDPETNRLYVHSHTAVFTLRNVPADLEPFDPSPAGQAENPRPPAAGGPPPGFGPGGPAPGGPPGGPGAPRVGTSLQGTIPLIKPPYDRITAYDMNTGEMLWQKAHTTTPDNIRNNPALAGIADRDRLGAYGRIFIGTLVTKSLVIAGEGDVHTNASGEVVALLRAYDKATGEDVAGEVAMPAKQTGSPMSYMHEGKQYIVVAVSRSGANAGAELIAYTLP
ncbi:MAG: PQQ-binding-like beta-propeller repeat protein [Gammaproteobacteria bacterium]